MPKFYGAIDLIQNELRQAVVQNLGTAPGSPVKGQMYFNSTDNTLYWWNGTTWVAASSAAGGPPSGTAGGDLGGTYPNPTVIKATGGGPSGFFEVGSNINVGKGISGSTQSVNLFDSTGTLSSQLYYQGGGFRVDGNAMSAVFVGSVGVLLQGSGGGRITGIGDPTAAQDAATKNYVDNMVQGLSWKNPCRIASTTNIAALSGLTAIDGVTPIAGDRILVKNQTTQSANGIYVAASGAWIRATDMNAAAEFPNAAVFVSEGTTQADTMWQQTANAPITVDTTNITWTQIGSASSYIGGAGLTLTGNTFDVVAADTTLQVFADGMAVNAAVVAMKSDLATIPRRYVTTLAGNVAYATGEVVTHGLNTRDVVVAVINGASPYNAVEVDWEATQPTSVTIRYNPALGAGYRAVVMGY